MTAEVAGVVLAAGAGERLRPLTELLPKPLCPVGNRALLDRALDRLHHGGLPLTQDAVAVNAHHLAGQIVGHLAARRDSDVHVSVEGPEALGTAGALGGLHDWLDGRDVLVHNGDVHLDDGDGSDGLVRRFIDGWDHERVRLLVTDDGTRRDFGPYRYIGVCLLPWRLVRDLAPTPSGLYEVMWREEAAHDRLDLVVTDIATVDCAGPASYLAANLLAAAGSNLVAVDADVSGQVAASIVGAGARVEGNLDRCVVWPGAAVAADEHLVDVIRATNRDGRPVTVSA